jgi:uncharacterized protein YecT (DUF1311 family)
VPESDVVAFERDCRAKLTPIIERQEQAMHSAEQEMASVYNGLMARLKAKDSQQAKAVLHDQRAWVKFRETHCWLEMLRAGGKYRLQYRFSMCVETEARKRMQYLRELEFKHVG